mmetsp:Transcript_81709/g.239876  ORF Transcript_81709/g.239876 Transcript_81709/m.239876 type:complete len:319 (-) Transcript_81709:461-1417(-)
MHGRHWCPGPQLRWRAEPKERGASNGLTFASRRQSLILRHRGELEMGFFRTELLERPVCIGRDTSFSFMGCTASSVGPTITSADSPSSEAESSSLSPMLLSTSVSRPSRRRMSRSRAWSLGVGSLWMATGDEELAPLLSESRPAGGVFQSLDKRKDSRRSSSWMEFGEEGKPPSENGFLDLPPAPSCDTAGHGTFSGGRGTTLMPRPGLVSAGLGLCRRMSLIEIVRRVPSGSCKSSPSRSSWPKCRCWRLSARPATPFPLRMLPETSLRTSTGVSSRISDCTATIAEASESRCEYSSAASPKLLRPGGGVKHCLRPG